MCYDRIRPKYNFSGIGPKDTFGATTRQLITQRITTRTVKHGGGGIMSWGFCHFIRDLCSSQDKNRNVATRAACISYAVFMLTPCDRKSLSNVA